MANFIPFSGIVIFLCIFNVFAVEVSDKELADLEKELQQTEFSNDEASLVDDQLRSGLGDLKEKMKDKCNCMKDKSSCGCCAVLEYKAIGLTLSGCVNVTVHANDKQIEIGLHVMNNPVTQHNFSFAPVEGFCGKLPGKMSFLGSCLNTTASETPENGLVVCSTFEIRVKSTTALLINFSCIQFKDGKLNFDDSLHEEKEAMFSMKFKNPIKSLVDKIKKWWKGNKD